MNKRLIGLIFSLALFAMISFLSENEEVTNGFDDHHGEDDTPISGGFENTVEGGKDALAIFYPNSPMDFFLTNQERVSGALISGDAEECALILEEFSIILESLYENVPEAQGTTYFMAVIEGKLHPANISGSLTYGMFFPVLATSGCAENGTVLSERDILYMNDYIIKWSQVKDNLSDSENLEIPLFMSDEISLAEESLPFLSTLLQSSNEESSVFLANREDFINGVTSADFELCVDILNGASFALEGVNETPEADLAFEVLQNDYPSAFVTFASSSTLLWDTLSECSNHSIGISSDEHLNEIIKVFDFWEFIIEEY